MNAQIVSTFSGTGGLDLAVEAVFSASTAVHAEIEPGPCKVLAAWWPGVPNLGDITAVNWPELRATLTGTFVILTGGFPCQDVSHAGRRRGLVVGSRSGLWTAMADAVDQLRPDLVVIENVRGLLSADGHGDVEPCPWCLGDEPSEPPMRALGTVLADLADIGYDAGWCGLRASDVGACHARFRVFVVAWPRPTVADPGGEVVRLGSGLRQGEPAGGWRGRPDHDSVPAHVLPTPTARDGKGHNQRRDASCLTGALLPTPQTIAEWQEAPPAWQRSTDSSRWGPYADAVARWQAVVGRQAPVPIETSVKGAQRLSPRFVEFMMGLPAGWVTDPGIGLARNEQLKALGNGVVPQQAAAAIRWLLQYVPAHALDRLTPEVTR